MGKILARGHSRVPVYSGNPRNIIGLLLVCVFSHFFTFNIFPFIYCLGSFFTLFLFKLGQKSPYCTARNRDTCQCCIHPENSTVCLCLLIYSCVVFFQTNCLISKVCYGFICTGFHRICLSMIYLMSSKRAVVIWLLLLRLGEKAKKLHK